MRSVAYFSLFCSLIFLNGCFSREGLLTKVWFFTYENKARAEESTDPELSPVSFLNLQSKGRYTANFGGFEYGEWSVEDKILLLKPTGGKERRVLMKKLTDKELVADLDPSNAYVAESRFEGFKNPLRDEEESPFSITNNKWRIKAKHKETSKEITDRLVNHFKYWEQYFRWGIESDKNSLDVRSHPSPLKMYGNGFALMPVDLWPEEWSRNFYDSSDRQAAFDKIRWTLRNKSVKWPESGHKFRQFVAAFQQMQTNVKYAK
ncbi:hypothetical protein [Pseudoflavitalea rhizosphaerae]|uniref:hypothetical protein n=1 Tax=Pseudoflavitalea rhizosphaerae TaxID=1884793 RepID=UPI000F8D4FC3|nr:hypothetical protein [Pseudoflavitalea rhizosphaerae]